MTRELAGDETERAPERGLRSATCEECGAGFLVEAESPGPRECARCFDRRLHGLERPFLDNYARFGARAHRTVAEALLRQLVLADPDDRKIMGMRIVEEYLDTASALLGLYTALRGRAQAPVLQTFLEYRLDGPSVRAFSRQVRGRLPEHVLAELGLPTPEHVEAQRASLPQQEYRELTRAVRAVTVGLQRAANAEQTALLRLADGLRAPSTLTNRLDWLPDRAMSPNQVALLVLERQRRRLTTHALSIDEQQLQVFIDAIDKLTQASRDLIWLYLREREG